MGGGFLARERVDAQVLADLGVMRLPVVVHAATPEPPSERPADLDLVRELGNEVGAIALTPAAQQEPLGLDGLRVAADPRPLVGGGWGQLSR